jgi:16S rRNA (guanine527-N7)-methyltransferase
MAADERAPQTEPARLAERALLIERAQLLEVPLSDAAATHLLTLLEELSRWNQAYNLTAIRRRDAMLTRHLLDSLAVHGDLEGTRVADVGTGAGFPGLPLAVANPRRQFTLIDSSGKKTRFVAHAAQALGLENVTVVHERAERLEPEVPFDTVIARAFAELPELLAKVRGLCGPRTRVLAMKGRYPKAEIAAVRAPWRVLATRALRVPGLEEARHLVTLEVGAPDLRPTGGRTGTLGG